MSKTSRISKKTFFAAALFGLASLTPAHAYLFEDELNANPDFLYDENNGDVGYFVDNDTADSFNQIFINTGVSGTGWHQFVKTGSGTLQVVSLGDGGGSAYNIHNLSYNPDRTTNPATIYVRRDNESGLVIAGTTSYELNDARSQVMSSWLSGEVVVAEGTVNLTGYVNMWVDFGSYFNSYLNSELGLNVDADGGMAGATRVTVRNGATLSLAGGNTTNSPNYVSTYGMVVGGSYTTFQFLHNLQSGDLGTDLDSTLYLGTSNSLHVDIHVDAWSENTRTDTGFSASGDDVLGTSYFDNALAFGGSIGNITGAGSIYKTGDGDFTILGSAEGFTGSLYAAGGELTLANTGGSSSLTLESASGSIATVDFYTTLSNATSVNIAGTLNTGSLATGGSSQGSAVRLNESYAVWTESGTDGDGTAITHVRTSVKESYFATPSAGTLVIAENQLISNFQSYFAAGITGQDGRTAAEAVRAAQTDTDGVLSLVSTDDSTDGTQTGTSDAPIIAGTGIGSQIVIPGGNYAKDAAGNYTSTFNVDENNKMLGGVLVIEQSAGMGGVYEGSIVGCRVAIYDKTAFAENTEDTETTAELDNAERLEEVRVGLTVETVSGIVGNDFTAEEISAFVNGIEADGSFALDNPLALAVVEYYKTGDSEGHQFYIDYIADEDVKGGLVVLRGAGDLALLLSSSNYSGIFIDEDRTGKTVLNISAINALDGGIVALGGAVSLVVDVDDTLRGQLSFAEDSSLIFSTADSVSTISGEVLVGDARKSTLSFTEAQEEIYGDIYIERGVTLRLTGTEATFPNANSLTIWTGSIAATEETADGQLVLAGNANQVIKNLTGDASAQILMSKGALSVNITDNATDNYSGLTLGTFDGSISGEGSLIKGGSGVFSLGGGENNRNFYGSTEVGAGTLSVTKANGLTGSSALIVDAGTTVALAGNQTLRNLFGAENSTLTLSDGVLTVGSNAAAVNGETRTLLSNNLGTSTTLTLGALGVDDSGLSISASRLEGYFAADGSSVSLGEITTETTQAAATQAYLSAVSKLAYSGYDVSALERYAAEKNYAGTEMISESDYEALLSFAKDGGRSQDSITFTLLGEEYTLECADGAFTLSQGATELVDSTQNIVSALSVIYGKLSAAQYFEDNVGTVTSGTYSGYYNPGSVLRQFFATDAAYQSYLSTFANSVTAAYQAAYGETYPANPTDAQIAQMNGILMEQIQAAYDALSVANGGVDLETSEIAGAVETLAGSGIAVVGAFGAPEYDSAGNLVSVSSAWTNDLAYAGTLTTPHLVKTGDNTLTLTGTLATDGIAVNGGTLAIDFSTLSGNPVNGITIARGADFSVNVALSPVELMRVGSETIFKVNAGTVYSVDADGVYDASGNKIYTVAENAGVTTVSDADGNTVYTVDANGNVSDARGNAVYTVSENNGVLVVSDANDNVVFAQTQNNIYRVDAVYTVGENGSVSDAEGNAVYSIVGSVVRDANGNVVFALSGGFGYAGNTLDAAISGLGDFVKTGEGFLLLGDDVRYLGTTTLKGGVLQMTLRNPIETESGTTLQPQGDIVLDGENLTLVLAQGDEDVSWDGSISAEAGASGTIEKNGEASLTINGDISLVQGTVNLAVLEGSLILNGELTLGSAAASSVLEIATGATLSVRDVNAENLSLTGNGAFIVAGGEATLSGASVVEEKFTGTVTVGSANESATLTLSGDSVLDEARAVNLIGASTLVIDQNSDQVLQSLSSSGTLATATVSIGNNASLTLKRPGTDGRLGMAYDTGSYVYDDSAIYDAPNFTGTVSGAGTLIVSGSTDAETGAPTQNGAVRFSGRIEVSDIRVENGGQVVLDVVDDANFASVNISVSNNSEVVFYVENDRAFDSSADVTFVDGGVFGKAGAGELRVSDADNVFSDADSVHVYDGTLTLSGLWTGSGSDADINIAQGATLAVNVEADSNVDFTQVRGSGTLKLTTEADDVSLIIGGDDGKATLPTTDSSGNGAFFNGVIAFEGSFDVSLVGGADEDSALTLSAINTDENVDLSISGYVELRQTQNSEIAGTLTVSSGAELLVVGSDANAGKVLSDDLRRLSITASDVSVQGDSKFVVENIGLGLGAATNDVPLSIEISDNSVANAFFIELGANDAPATSLVASGTVIDIDLPTNNPEVESKLTEVSFIKNGAGTLALTGSRLDGLYDAAQENASDGVFGLTEDVYRALADNGGTLYIGTEEGRLILSGLNDFDGKLTVDDAEIDVEYVTLRSSVAATAGTLVIDSSTASGSTYAVDDSLAWQTLAQTISGSGNVEFSGDAGTGTLVTAAQEYYGATTVSGTVEFSGDGRTSHSSDFTVADGGVLYGGVTLNAREVSYQMTARRNMNDSGTAGTATLSLSLSDVRLPSAISCQFEVSSSGAISNFATTGSLPAGVSVALKTDNRGDFVGVSDGKIELIVTDTAYGSDYSYSVFVDVNTSNLPALGETYTASGSTSGVAGTFVLENGGKVVLNAAAGDVISAGTVNINTAGGKIALDGLDGASSVGKVYTIVTATENGGRTLTENVAGALRRGLSEKYNASDYDGDDISVAIYTSADGQSVCAVRLVEDFSDVAGVDYNSGISGSFLDSLSELSGASAATNYVLNLDTSRLNSELLLALNGISADRLEQEVERLSPIGFASMLAMPAETFDSDVQTIHRRLDQRRYDGANPLREDTEYEFFFTAQTEITENGNGSDNANFDYNLYGALAGFDWKPDFETTLGLAVGYTFGKAKIDSDGGKVKMNDMRLTAYGSRFFGDFYVEGGAQIGWADFDTRRHTVAGTTSGSTDALLGGAFITVGSVYTLYQNKRDVGGLYLTPTVGLSYMHTSIDGFRESGLAGLDLDDADGDSLRLRFAAALQWDTMFDDWRIRLGFEAAYYHDFLGDEIDFDGQFTAGGSGFGVSANALSPDVFSLGPTLDILLTERDSIFCGYGFRFDLDSGTSHNLNVGYRHRF